MHILFVSSGYPNTFEPLDGVFYRDQARAVHATGNKVGVISAVPISIFSVIRCKKFKFGKEIMIDQGIPTYTWSYLNIPKRPKYPISMASKKGMKMFEKYILKYGKPDILHLHCFEGGEFALKVKERYNIPYVITEHSSRFLLNTNPKALEPTIFEVFKQADTRIAVSKTLKKRLEKTYNLEFSYIPNMLDNKMFSYNSSIKKNEIFTYVNVAGLNKNKNQKMLLTAFKDLLDSGIKAQLKIAGEGPILQLLKEHTEKLGIEKSVSFLGYQTRSELNQLFNESHVFVLSSKKETFGVSLIEALSCGMPVISTYSGGPESIITDSKLGILSEISVSGLSSAMQQIHNEFNDFDPYYINSHVSEQFSGNAIASRLVATYKRIINNLQMKKE